MAEEESPNGSESVIRNDRVEIRRTDGPPYSAICVVSTRWRTGVDTLGTGYIFGERLVVTAGHNLYNSAPLYGGMAYDVQVFPGTIGGSLPYGFATVGPPGLRLFPTFLRGEVRADDFGAILLPEPIGRKTGWCDLAPYDALKIGDQVVMAGYPAVNEGNWTKLKLMRSQGAVTGFRNGFAEYDADGEAGQSGGPVWRASDHFPYLMMIGLHNAEYKDRKVNIFTPFTWLHYDWIQARSRESQGLPFADLDAAVAAGLPSAYRANWRLQAAVKGRGPSATPVRIPPRRPGRRGEVEEPVPEGGGDTPRHAAQAGKHEDAEPPAPVPPTPPEDICFTVRPKGREGISLDLTIGQILRGSVKVALAAGTFTDCDLLLEDEDGNAVDHLPMFVSSAGADDFHSERFKLTAQSDGPHRLVLKELNGVSAAIVRIKLKPDR